MGGLIKIWAVPSNVFSINGKTVSISDLTNVYEIYCTPSSLDFKEPEVFNDSGTSYISTINGFIPGITEPNLEAIEYIERRKWVVIIQDGNKNGCSTSVTITLKKQVSHCLTYGTALLNFNYN